MRFKNIFVLLLLIFGAETFAQNYFLPAQSPFTHNTGIAFNVLMTKWYVDPSIMYDPAKRIECATERMKVIAQRIKLIRTYSFFINGFESTGDLDPNAAALMNLINSDKEVEGVIGNSENKAWYLQQDNTDAWVSKLKDQLGDNVSQVKCIIIGNEVNANNWTPGDIDAVMKNFKSSLNDAGLSICVTTSFNNLGVGPGADPLEPYVAAVVNNWDEKWNGGFPFVFIDPYPGAPGIPDAAGVFNWQTNVMKFYQQKYPKLQIFISETGAQGAANDAASVPVINSIYAELDKQYKAKGKTVPTFLFEAVDEPLKGGTPLQNNMGVYQDNNVPTGGSSITLKPGIVLPDWIK